MFNGEGSSFELPMSEIEAVSFKKKAAILINTRDHQQYGFVLLSYNEYQDTITRSVFGSTGATGVGLRPWAMLKGLLGTNAMVGTGKQESVRWQEALTGKVRFK